MAVIEFRADKGTYLRSQAWLAALAMAGAMLVLWLLGNAYVWTGAVAGLAAIALRGWYLASEELSAVWKIENDTLVGPREQTIALTDIAAVRILGSFVQVITQNGHKYLIKHQLDAAKTMAEIEKARL